MSEGQSLSSEEFDQLQKYAEYSSKKIKDVLTEFNEGGSLKQCDTHKPISYDVFKLFMRAYLEVDLPLPLSTHLFLAFSQKPRQETPDHPKEGASSSEPNVSDCNADNAAKADEACAPDTESKTAKTQAPPKDLKTVTPWEDPDTLSSSPDAPMVYLKDVVCYLSLLETGRPQDKLEFMFRLYDSDENGLLDQAEMDQIVNQMLHIAQYLEWDPTELRPILKEMLQGMDYDKDGFVSLQEWVHGGMTTIPLLVLLGMDDSGSTGDGRHAWTLKHFKKPTYCNFCHIMLMGVRKQGLSCIYCKYTVHQRCVSKNIPGCVKTYSKAKRSGEVGDAYWHILLHAASGTTWPSSQIPMQEGALRDFSSSFSVSRTTPKPSHSFINPFSISLRPTACQALYQGIAGSEKRYPVCSNAARVTEIDRHVRVVQILQIHSREVCALIIGPCGVCSPGLKEKAPQRRCCWLSSWNQESFAGHGRGPSILAEGGSCVQTWRRVTVAWTWLEMAGSDDYRGGQGASQGDEALCDKGLGDQLQN